MLATLVLNCTPVCKQNSLTWLCHCDCSLNQRSGVRIQSSETSEFMNQAKGEIVLNPLNKICRVCL